MQQNFEEFLLGRVQLWASLVAQLVKNLPAMQETACNAGDSGSILDQENPLEKEMATYSSILAWEILDRGVWWATVHEVAKESDMT